jgi:hypothetical protein
MRRVTWKQARLDKAEISKSVTQSGSPRLFFYSREHAIKNSQLATKHADCQLTILATHPRTHPVYKVVAIGTQNIALN